MYLQHDDVNKHSMAKDTALRTVTLDTFAYRIQPNDIISVKFESLTSQNFNPFSGASSLNSTGTLSQGNPLLLGELVDENGMIVLSALGKVKVSGLTVYEVQEKLREHAKAFLDSPIVRVRLLNYRITILGEVNKEGTVTIENNRVSILEAIGLAGGLGEFADKSAVKLIRQTGPKVEVIYLNLLDEKFVDSPYYYVHQNDILVVPPAKQRPFLKYFNQNFAIALSVISLGFIILTYTTK
jgi:polysaccharide export outer membrane protein